MVAYRSRIARWREIALPVNDNESAVRFQDTRDLSEAGPLIGNRPNDINTERAVYACRFETGRGETSALVRAGATEPTRSRSRLFQRSGGEIDAHQRSSCKAGNPLAGATAAASLIGDFIARANMQRIRHLTEFGPCNVAVGGFIGRIFLAESLQIKPAAKFGNPGFGVESIPGLGS